MRTTLPATVSYSTGVDGKPSGTVTMGNPNATGAAGSKAPVTVTNVAAGAVNSTSTDAVNGSQLFSLSTSASTGVATLSTSTSTAVSSLNTSTAGLATALGGGASIGKDGAVTAPAYSVGGTTYNNVGSAINALNEYSHSEPLSISDAKGNLLGSAAYAAIPGNESTVNGTDGSTAVGTAAQVNGNGGSAYGNQSSAGAGATAIGDNASASSTGSVAVGQGASITPSKGADNIGAVAIGYGAKANSDPGTAVGAESNAAGANSAAYGAGAVANGNNSVALGSGSVANRANSVSVGNAHTGLDRQITNVAPGTAPTDAVNLSQLNQSVGNAITQTNKFAASGIAAALAMPGSPTLCPGMGYVGLQTGEYDGQTAVGARFTYQMSKHWNANIGVSGGTGTYGHVAVTAGVGYAFGINK